MGKEGRAAAWKATALEWGAAGRQGRVGEGWEATVAACLSFTRASGTGGVYLTGSGSGRNIRAGGRTSQPACAGTEGTYHMRC